MFEHLDRCVKAGWVVPCSSFLTGASSDPIWDPRMKNSPSHLDLLAITGPTLNRHRTLSGSCRTFKPHLQPLRGSEMFLRWTESWPMQFLQSRTTDQETEPFHPPCCKNWISLSFCAVMVDTIVLRWFCFSVHPNSENENNRNALFLLYCQVSLLIRFWSGLVFQVVSESSNNNSDTTSTKLQHLASFPHQKHKCVCVKRIECLQRQITFL